MGKKDKIEVEGKVTEVLKGSYYLVELENGHTVTAYVSGKMRINMKKICKKCKIIRRKGKVRVICENPKHKQVQG